MKIHNLKMTKDSDEGEQASASSVAGERIAKVVGSDSSEFTHQALEIAMLKAHIQHLELVVETARSLMGSNQERLLRQLHEVPREMMALSAQLRRVGRSPNT